MTDIALGAKRYDGANGSALFGGTVPFPPGAMFEADIALIRLYDGSTEADISTEVTFEDGRKGVLSARVKIRDMAPAAPAALEKAA